MRETAYFVKTPRWINDLLLPHKLEDEVPYQIVQTIQLSRIEYENLIADLTADRQYIERHAHLCGIQDGVWKCLLIQQRINGEGILIMPKGGCWVGYAAFWGQALPRKSR